MPHFPSETLARGFAKIAAVATWEGFDGDVIPASEAETWNLVGWSQHSGRMAKTSDTNQSTMFLLQNFQPGGPENLTGTDGPRHPLQRKRMPSRLLSGTSMAAISCATQRCFSPIWQPWTHLTLKLVQKEITNRQTSLLRHRIGQYSSDWRISEVRILATVDTAVRGKHHARSRGGATTLQKCMLFEPCTNAFRCARTRRQNLPLSAKVWV